MDAVDPELEEMKRANRRAAGMRLVVAGLVIALASGAVLAYAMALDHQQAGSQVQFLLPARLEIVGGVGIVIGVLLILPGIFSLVRSRGRVDRLPVAKLRE